MGYNTTLDGTQIFAEQRLTLGQAKFLEINGGFESINVNGLPAGTPLVLWNGTGAGDTGGDWTLGGDYSEESAIAMHSGTNGLDTGERSNGEYTSFVTDPSFDIQASYGSISFWINPQRKDVGVTIRLRWFNDGTNVGTLVIVDNYVPNFDLDVWQKVTIQLADFALPPNQLVDELRIQYYGLPASKKQRYFFDDIELNPVDAGGGPYTFRVEADGYSVYHVDQIVLVIATSSSGWNSGDFTNIMAGLENGMIIRHFNKGTSENLWSISVRNNLDLFGRFYASNNVTFFDNEQLMTFIMIPRSASIQITDNEVLDIIINDNLSSLTNFRAFVHYGKEEII